MNRTIGRFFIAVSTAALFAGCVDFPGASGAEATPDDVSAVPAVPGAPVVASAATPALAQAYAFASQNADAHVATRPAVLHASSNEAFAQTRVESSSGIFYVAYERTHAGLHVVGGDFVTVLDSQGQIIHTSISLDHPIEVASLTPTLSQAGAEAIASRQLRSVTGIEGTQLVVNALGPTARLAWEIGRASCRERV